MGRTRALERIRAEQRAVSSAREEGFPVMRFGPERVRRERSRSRSPLSRGEEGEREQEGDGDEEMGGV